MFLTLSRAYGDWYFSPSRQAAAIGQVHRKVYTVIFLNFYLIIHAIGFISISKYAQLNFLES